MHPQLSDCCLHNSFSYAQFFQELLIILPDLGKSLSAISGRMNSFMKLGKPELLFSVGAREKIHCHDSLVQFVLVITLFQLQCYGICSAHFPEEEEEVCTVLCAYIKIFEQVKLK